jgi:DNA-binding NtrC family response regulator
MESAIILVVDDEEKLRANLRDAFEDMGHRVLTAESAEEALLVLSRGKVDACTVDIRLPGMSGNNFIRKAGDMFPGLKFVIYTGSWNYQLPDELSEYGVKPDHVFNKPCDDLMLIGQAIEKLLGVGG